MQDLVKLLLFTASTPLTMAFLRRLSSARTAKRALTTSHTHTHAPSVSHLRKEYSHQGLLESDFSPAQGPLALFQRWLQEAIEAKTVEPNAMCLSTCDSDGRPSARYVLLKGLDERGFTWYTNYESRKGQELASNPHAALTFWWGELERSVRVEGQVERVSEEESDKYFHSRPRGSQIGAWSSNQSRVIAGRDALEAQEKAIVEQFEGLEVIP